MLPLPDSQVTATDVWFIAFSNIDIQGYHIGYNRQNNNIQRPIEFLW